MMLLAARAITFLADVVPATASAIVRHGAVTVLCARLLSIDYIDLAEQSLQALNKLSMEHPQVASFLPFLSVIALVLVYNVPAHTSCTSVSMSLWHLGHSEESAISSGIVLHCVSWFFQTRPLSNRLVSVCGVSRLDGRSVRRY